MVLDAAAIGDIEILSYVSRWIIILDCFTPCETMSGYNPTHRAFLDGVLSCSSAFRFGEPVGDLRVAKYLK